MTEMTEQQIKDGWREANMSRIVSEMDRYSITLDELTAYWHNHLMVNIARTSTPNQPNRNTVAGE